MFRGDGGNAGRPPNQKGPRNRGENPSVPRHEEKKKQVGQKKKEGGRKGKGAVPEVKGRGKQGEGK